MKNEGIKIEERLKNMKRFYLKAGEIIDDLPDGIPDSVTTMLKNKILGDESLKELMEGLDEHRPPRFLLIGRTGVGKSSLINALCGAYVAKVSSVRSCTDNIEIYKCEEQGRTLMEILDTRGIAESSPVNSEKSAEEQLLEQVNKFSPDVAILMLSCTHRDSVNEDVQYLKKIVKEYSDLNKVELPVVVVVNRADEVAPSREKDPTKYPINKENAIKDIEKYFKRIVVENGLKIEDIIAVSSLLDWKTKEGIEISFDNINCLPKRDQECLEIAYDGRYQVDQLLNILENAILDFRGQMGLRMALRLEELVKKIAKHLSKIFATIAGTIAFTPLPISDLYILIVLQSCLVVMIAALSGREITIKAAKEFILSLGGVAGLGYGFKLGAQQASKILNIFWPGFGSGISVFIATQGTYAIGRAAIAYYIDGDSIKKAKKLYDESRENDEEIEIEENKSKS